LGRHFKAELERRGYEVTGLDVKATSAQDCRRFFQQQARHPEHDWMPFDLVVHCAAVVGGRETIERDPLATAESLSIDAEMFRWAAIARPGRVLYFSSSAAYPVSLQEGLHYQLHEDDVWGEDGLIDPDEVYGWGKVTGELLADRLRATGVPVTVVRPFSGYGEDQDPSYPFRAILDRVKAGDDPVEVWCGDCTRDWIHVDDLVAGALAVAEDGTEAPVNLCTGEPTSFSTLVQMMIRETVLLRPRTYLGGLPSVQFRPEMPQGVAYRVGDPGRMLEIYQPTVSLEEGIRRALSL
jgi:nucleoside-diphosphate-sugar epimerase